MQGLTDGKWPFLFTCSFDDVHNFNIILIICQTLVGVDCSFEVMEAESIEKSLPFGLSFDMSGQYFGKEDMSKVFSFVEFFRIF